MIIKYLEITVEREPEERFICTPVTPQSYSAVQHLVGMNISHQMSFLGPK